MDSSVLRLKGTVKETGAPFLQQVFEHMRRDLTELGALAGLPPPAELPSSRCEPPAAMASAELAGATEATRCPVSLPGIAAGGTTRPMSL